MEWEQDILEKSQIEDVKHARQWVDNQIRRNIPIKLIDDVFDYCQLNDISIDKISNFFNKLVLDSFLILKYGSKPFDATMVLPSKEITEEVKTFDETTIATDIKETESIINDEVILIETTQTKSRTIKSK